MLHGLIKILRSSPQTLKNLLEMGVSVAKTLHPSLCQSSHELTTHNQMITWQSTTKRLQMQGFGTQTAFVWYRKQDINTQKVSEITFFAFQIHTPPGTILCAAAGRGRGARPRRTTW